MYWNMTLQSLENSTETEGGKSSTMFQSGRDGREKLTNLQILLWRERRHVSATKLQQIKIGSYALLNG